MIAPDLSRAVWRKTSHSNADHNCVEVAFTWRKSSYSDADTNCVEVARDDRITAVRDSKNPTGPVLTVGPQAWRAVTQLVRD